MTNRHLIAALLVLLIAPAVGVVTAQAQSLKIGYTDPELLIANMPEYRQIQEQLQREYEGGQQELQSLYLDYQGKVEDYQRKQALMSAESRQKREQELMEIQGQMQQAAAEKEQALAAREQELARPLFQRVQTAIDEVSRQRALDIVLRAPLILYVNESATVNITEDVARRLGIAVDETASTQ
jgi:outer membrane protein